MEEVYCTIFDLPSSKSPGLDEFNIEFFCNFWPIIGNHLFLAIRYFFDYSIMPSSWGKTFIILIPKKEKPKTVLDFSPISLCNVCFKIITKILANRIKIVLPHLISCEQAGFVAGRNPFDNIIAIQEIAHTLENDTMNPPRMLIKLDVKKAYDNLN